ncbi:MAG: hypothetical protein Q9212_000483 [Teloschistes hypoglaucus]
MESLEGRRSSLKATHGQRRQGSLGKTGRDLIANGLVSSRIQVYGKKSSQQEDHHNTYAPFLPFTRFERVQTYEEWPSQNASLYNQPHSRTMTLSPNLTTYKIRIAQQQEQGASPSHDDVEKRLRTARSPGLARLMHLWESKGSSIPMTGHTVPQQPQLEERGGLRLLPRGEAEIRTPVPSRLPLKDHTRAFRSVNPQPELITPDHVSLLQDDTRSSGSIPSSVLKRRPASHAHHPQRADTSDQDSDTRSSTPGSFYTSEDYTNSTVLHIEPSNVSQEQSGHRWEMQNIDSDISLRTPIDRFDKRLEVEMSLQRNLPANRHGIRSKKPRKRPEERGGAGGTIDVRPGRSLSGSILDNGHLWNKQACKANHEQQNAAADQCWRSDNRFSALATRPSSSRQYKHLKYYCQSPLANSTRAVLLPHEDFPGDPSLPAVASSVLSEPTTPQDRLRSSGRGKSQSAEKIRQPRQASLVRSPSTKEHLTSSAEYYSLGSTGSRSRQASPNGNLKTLEQGMTEPSMVDAATQTESMDHSWEETTSQRSENASGARHDRQGVFHRVSRPIRLERKLRRPTMRKVQVIVSLDGATDRALNARLVPKRPQE